jgi:hypothetical protein
MDPRMLIAHSQRRYQMLGNIMRSAALAVAMLASTAAAPQDMNSSHSAHSHATGGGDPEINHSGQAAFAALSEAVAVLETDPSTDWSKANITELRDHLLDMDEVVMRSHALVVEEGDAVHITVTGNGRTLAAIQRMVPAHARMMNGHRRWQSQAQARGDGVIWTIRTKSADERMRIKALGFYGLLTLGSHHAPHHLAIAKGEPHG